MCSDRVRQCFIDIRDAISLIHDWVREAGDIHMAVSGKPVYRSAIERQLLVVSEAAIRLHKLDAQLAPRLAPNIDWSGIRGIGNFIRHKYDDLDSQIIADVLNERLAILDEACALSIASLDGDAGPIA